MISSTITHNSNTISIEMSECGKTADLIIKTKHLSFLSPLLFVVCVQASSGRCEGGGRVEEVLRAEEAPWRVGLHTQEPVQTTGGVSSISPCTSFWYNEHGL